MKKYMSSVKNTDMPKTHQTHRESTQQNQIENDQNTPQKISMQVYKQMRQSKAKSIENSNNEICKF